MSAAVFERISDGGIQAVRAGRVDRERPPSEGGRWGLSLVLRPFPLDVQALESLLPGLVNSAGADHWQSGTTGAAHITVRSLEPFSAHDADRRHVARISAAMARSVSGLTDVKLRLDGLLLSAGGVIVRASTPDGTAQWLRQRVAQELGDDGWFEDQHFDPARDPVWYLTLLHFAGPIQDAEQLIDFVSDRSDLYLGIARFPTLSLCRFRFDGHRMVPIEIASVPFG